MQSLDTKGAAFAAEKRMSVNISHLARLFAKKPAPSSGLNPQPPGIVADTGAPVMVPMVPMRRRELFVTLHLGEAPASKTDPVPEPVASGVMSMFEAERFLWSLFDTEEPGAPVDLTAMTSFSLDRGAFIRIINYRGRCIGQAPFSSDATNVVAGQVLSTTLHGSVN